MRITALAAALAFAFFGANGGNEAKAQLDVGHSVPGVIVLTQLDRVVGMAWADGDPATPCVYDEYWFLTPDYVYPASKGAGETIKTTLTVAENGPKPKTFSEFFTLAAERLGKGKRIKTSVIEEDHCGADGF